MKMIRAIAPARVDEGEDVDRWLLGQAGDTALVSASGVGLDALGAYERCSRRQQQQDQREGDGNSADRMRRFDQGAPMRMEHTHAGRPWTGFEMLRYLRLLAQKIVSGEPARPRPAS